MRIGFIGAGNMVSAIVRGAVAAGTPAGHLLLTSKHGSAERLAGQVGAVHVPDAAELVSRSDVLIVGLKPYVIPDVLPRLSEAIVASRPLVVSIAAGVPVERLESMLPGGTRVVRTMPNMAASVGESMTALTPGSSASAQDLETVRTLMETIGRTVILEEKDFVTVEDEVTGERRNVTYEKGQFVYRLSGRDRQRSASFYTPEVLTRFTVQQALEELLDQDGRTTTAEEILHLTVCEPALGSGAFAIEAVRQLAEQYLSRRERELGRRVDPEERPRELAKVKAYLALHQVYGVDLNATAVERAGGSRGIHRRVPDAAGRPLRTGDDLTGHHDPAADPGAESDHGEGVLPATGPEPCLGIGEGAHIIGRDAGQPGGLGDHGGQRYVAPPQEAGHHHSPSPDGGPPHVIGHWLAGAVRGDLGRSWVSGADVGPDAVDAFGVSLSLMAAALGVGVGDLVDDDGQGVGQLVAHALQGGLTHELGDHDLLGLVGDLTGGVQRRGQGHVLEKDLLQDVDLLVALG